MIEVHYKTSSGIFNPFANKRLQRFLEQEIERSEKVAEGFCVPSVKFTLVMQLAHIQHHFFKTGIGLKQLVDYYVLLQQVSDEERAEVSAMLRRLVHPILNRVNCSYAMSLMVVLLAVWRKEKSMGS